MRNCRFVYMLAVVTGAFFACAGMSPLVSDRLDTADPTCVLKANSDRLFSLKSSPGVINDQRVDQMSLMTNLMLCAVNTNTFAESNQNDRVSLVAWALSLPAVRNNPESLAYCADLIASVSCISTNAYIRELEASYTADRVLQGGKAREPGTISMGKYLGPNLKAFHAKWRTVFEHNRLIVQFRSRVVRELCSALDSYSATMGEAKGMQLKDRIAKLCALTEAEKRAVLKEKMSCNAQSADSPRP